MQRGKNTEITHRVKRHQNLITSRICWQRY